MCRSLVNGEDEIAPGLEQRHVGGQYTRAQCDPVGAACFVDSIRAVTTAEHIAVVSIATLKQISARSAGERVVTAAAKQEVVARTAFERVVPFNPERGRGVGIAVDKVIAATAAQRVIPWSAVDSVVATERVNHVVPAIPEDNICALRGLKGGVVGHHICGGPIHTIAKLDELDLVASSLRVSVARH